MEQWLFICKIKKNPHLALYAKLVQNGSFELFEKSKTIKPLEENIGENLCDHVLIQVFF